MLAATYQLLTESGLPGVSIDEVSRRSGVAKTTVYRHWASRTALLLDACSQMSSEPVIPDTGDLTSDLGVLAGGLADQLGELGWSVVLPSIIDAAERDPDTAQVHAALHQGLMQPFFTVIERARQRGELADDRPPTTLVALLVGPISYRRWFSREPLDTEFIDHLVRTAVPRTG